MTCRDCVHRIVCMFWYGSKDEEICRHFKDKAKVARLLQGEWVKKEQIYKCSNCEFAIGVKVNYCPGCGAYMKGKDDHNE